MKLVLLVISMLISSLVVAQQWRDSLDAARSAYDQKNYKKALDYYSSAQKLAPESVDLSDEMGQSAYKLGDFKRAEEIFQQSSSSKSNSQKADGFHNLGNSRMKQQNYQGAIEAYKESLRANPNDDKTRYNLSEAMRKLKNQQQKQDQSGGGGDGESEQNQNQDNQDEPKEGDSDSDQEKNEQPADRDKNESQKGNSKKNESPSNKGQLTDKNVEKILDELMRREAETKRRMYGSKGGFTPKSGKDW